MWMIHEGAWGNYYGVSAWCERNTGAGRKTRMRIIVAPADETKKHKLSEKAEPRDRRYKGLGVEKTPEIS
jgi:hypothetical protein